MGLAASKGTRAKWVAISSYIASALLYLLAMFTGNFTIRTTSANCLVTIEVPYSLVSLFATLAAIGVLFFGITLSIAILRGRTTKLGRLLLSSGLLSAGVLAILFAVFWYWVNWSDEGPRCGFANPTGCAPSLLQDYQTVYTASAILAILGLVAAGFGAYLLMRRVTVIRSSSSESGAETSSQRRQGLELSKHHQSCTCQKCLTRHHPKMRRAVLSEPFQSSIRPVILVEPNHSKLHR